MCLENDANHESEKKENVLGFHVPKLSFVGDREKKVYRVMKPRMIVKKTRPQGHMIFKALC